MTAINPRKITHWIIRADQPFTGFSKSFMLPGSDKVAYTDPPQTFEEYAAECGEPLKLITDAELDALIDEYTASQITDATPITAEDWDYSLNVLPPCKWGSYSGVELFHVSELLYGNIASWYARIAGSWNAETKEQAADHFYTFNDTTTRDPFELAAKVKAAHEKGKANG